MKKLLILVFLFLLLPALVLAEEPVREWKSMSGKTISAVWVMDSDVGEGRIRLRSGNKNFRVRLDKLSEADQKYVKEKLAAGNSRNTGGEFEDITDETSNSRGMAIVEKSRRYALLIGVNAYAEPIHSLRYCANDMETLAKSFQKIGVPKENIFLMTDDSKPGWRPTRQNIERQIESITQLMGPNDQLTIAFSGHGVMIDDKSYLCPSDTDIENPNSVISRDWAFEQMEKCKARQKIFIVDACRDEVGFSGSRALGGAKTLADPIGAKTYGFILIASCAKKQQSWEDENLEHGVFTHFLAQGLSGEVKDPEGYVTILNLFSYASNETKRHVFRKFNRVQVPTIQLGGEMTDFAFAKIKTAEPAPEVTPEAVTQTSPVSEPVRNGDIETLKKQLDSLSIEYEVLGDSVTITRYEGSSSSVDIPYGVTTIGEYAFQKCSSLTSVTIPDSVTTIKRGAFGNCASLRSVTIPDGVTAIGGSAFYGCMSLTSLTIPDSVMTIGESAFSSCTSLTSLTISANVTIIDRNVFSGCSSLTSVTIPASVATIGERAFFACTSLKSVTIPNNVTNIGKWAFAECKTLTSATIAPSVTRIEFAAFSGCNNLTIYGKRGSEAERYVHRYQHRINFRAKY